MNKCSEELSAVSGINISYAEADEEYMQLEVGKYQKTQ